MFACGSDPVIDPREDESEEQPIPGFRPVVEWLPSMVEPGAIRKSWGSASAEGQMNQDERWARVSGIQDQIWWEHDPYNPDLLEPSDPATGSSEDGRTTWRSGREYHNLRTSTRIWETVMSLAEVATRTRTGIPGWGLVELEEWQSGSAIRSSRRRRARRFWQNNQ